jgi:HAD superfamily hydrolase (TIGR01509 family)
MPKSVIFDLFETLVTENHAEWHAEKSSRARRLGIPEEVFKREWAVHYMDRMTGILPNYAAVLQRICLNAGLEPPYEEIEALQQEGLRAKSHPFERTDSAVLNMLDKLRAEGYAIGVISNCAFDQVLAWYTSPLAARVDEVIFSCVVGKVKPDSAIYELACNRLGCEPAHAVFVGDGGSDELRGAQAAGLKAIWGTWFIEHWPWDWVDNVAATASDFPRCRSVLELPKLVETLLSDYR